MGLLLIAIAVVLCIFFDISRVRANAMMPALNQGDIVLSWTPPSGFNTIGEGDIYFVEYGDSENAPNFMRVIACGDHTVSFRDDALRIDSSALLRQALTNDAIERPPEEPRIWRESIGKTGTSWKIMLPQTPVVSHKEGEIKLNADACFIAGDNRMSSYDSRQTGALPKNNIRGKALIILKSSNDDGLIGPYIRFL